MRILARLMALAFGLGILVHSAHAQDPTGKYTDSLTSQWFKSLLVPGTTHGCCDQADCHKTPADFIDGVWVAESKFHTDGSDQPEWVLIPPERIIIDPTQIDIFPEAILCESDHQNGDDPAMVTVHKNGSIHPADWTTMPKDQWAHVYCFDPPPQYT